MMTRPLNFIFKSGLNLNSKSDLNVKLFLPTGDVVVDGQVVPHINAHTKSAHAFYIVT